MTPEHPPASPTDGDSHTPLPRRLAILLPDLGITAGEAVELLERLPFGAAGEGAAPEIWDRPIARRLLERHAARKRAVARLARRGSL